MVAASSSPHRARFTIVIAPGLWGKRFEVSVEPPIASHPLRSFRTRGEALAAAEDLGRVEGWPVSDRCSSKGGNT